MNSVQSNTVHAIPKWNAEKNEFLTTKYKELEGSALIWMKLAKLINEKFSMSLTNDQVKHHHANCRVDVDRSSLTEEEAKTLLSLIKRHGNDWKTIGESMNRTPNKVKAYYHTKLKPCLPPASLKMKRVGTRSKRINKERELRHEEEDLKCQVNSGESKLVSEGSCSVDGQNGRSCYNLRPRKVNPNKVNPNPAHEAPVSNKVEKESSFQEPESESNNSTLLVSPDEYFRSWFEGIPEGSAEENLVDFNSDYPGVCNSPKSIVEQEYQNEEQQDCHDQVSPLQIDFAHILEQNQESSHWSLFSKNITQVVSSSSSLIG